jgi:hypothetical protein
MAVYSHNPLCITDVQISDTSPCVITFSAEYAPGYEAYRSFDHLNIITNSWYSYLATTGWIEVDLGEGITKSITSYTVSFPYDYVDFLDGPNAWTIRGSANGTSWTTVDTQTGQSWSGANEMKTFTLGYTTSAYRYWLMDITSNCGGNSLMMGELELIGPAVGPVSYNRNNIMIF